VHLRPFILCAALLACGACGTKEGDPHSDHGVPNPAGKDQRIHEIADPESPLKAAHEQTVQVSGAVVVAIDRYNETTTGRSSGTIYVADLGSQEPYSGISLFNPSFIPGNLRVTEGDTLDLRGQFQENQDTPQQFAPGAFLVQLANPIGTFRFDAKVPEPIDIDINDLADYETGRRWLNMIVRVQNVTLEEDLFFRNEAGEPGPSKNGRLSADLLPNTNDKTACQDPFPKPPTIVNELMDVLPLKLEKGTQLKSLTGLVTFFCNLHIAPRTAADIVR
jgi:hypothetical protein